MSRFKIPDCTTCVRVLGLQVRWSSGRTVIFVQRDWGKPQKNVTENSQSSCWSLNDVLCASLIFRMTTGRAKLLSQTNAKFQRRQLQNIDLSTYNFQSCLNGPALLPVFLSQAITFSQELWCLLIRSLRAANSAQRGCRKTDTWASDAHCTNWQVLHAVFALALRHRVCCHCPVPWSPVFWSLTKSLTSFSHWCSICERISTLQCLSKFEELCLLEYNAFISQKIQPFITTAVRTPGPTKLEFDCQIAHSQESCVCKCSRYRVVVTDLTSWTLRKESRFYPGAYVGLLWPTICWF